jgi:heat shock protein HslJ
MKTKITVIIFLIAILSAACSLNSFSASDPLNGGQWVLVSMNGDAALIGNPLSVGFEDGMISGNAGCNSFQGSYSIEGDSLAVGPLARTEIYCQDPHGVMDQEDRFLEILAAADSFILEEGRLKISGNGVQLEFWILD